MPDQIVVQDADQIGVQDPGQVSVLGAAPSVGGGIGFFVFVQSTPATVWSVVHNLGREPSVQVRDTSGNLVVTDVIHVDPNSLSIVCNPALAGSVYCV